MSQSITTEYDVSGSMNSLTSSAMASMSFVHVRQSYDQISVKIEQYSQEVLITPRTNARSQDCLTGKKLCRHDNRLIPQTWKTFAL